MDKDRLITLLTRKMSGELSSQELEELRTLLAECPEGLYYEQFFKEFWQKKKPVEIDIDKKYELHRQRHGMDVAVAVSQLGHDDRLGGRKRWWRNKTVVIVTSAAVLLACVTVFFSVWEESTDTTLSVYDRSVVNHTEIAATRGIRKSFLLPDGTKVWLNADSRISYSNFDGSSGERKVTLEGEAFFDVVKDVDRPFIITTEKQTIKVLGTTFNIKAYPDDKQTETTLLSGMIELSIKERPDEKIHLKPNQKLVLTEDLTFVKTELEQGVHELNSNIRMTVAKLAPVKIGNKEYIKETSWVENKLVFKDESFSELIPKIERWYDVNIVLENKEMNSYRFTGTITNERIDQMLSALQLVNKFNFKHEENNLIIY